MSELSEEEKQRVHDRLREVREALQRADEHVKSAESYLAILKNLLGKAL